MIKNETQLIKFFIGVQLGLKEHTKLFDQIYYEFEAMKATQIIDILRIIRIPQV